MTAKLVRYVAIEGPDRVGKATQTKMLVAFLKSCYDEALSLDDQGVHINVKSYEIPAKGAFYKTIYWMLRNGTAKKFPNIFQTIQFLNKFTFQTLNFCSNSLAITFIVLDRWKLSTQVYGQATGVHKILLKFLDKFLIEPDVTIVLKGHAQVEEARDSYEKDSALQTKVRQLYVLNATERHNHYIIDANQTREKVHKDIINALIDARILTDVTFLV